MAVRVYVVEPNLYNRLVLYNILTTHGFSVCGESSSGRTAVEEYEHLRPDIVILPASMPDMDGVATIKALRLKDVNAATILVASSGQRGTVVEALGAGAIDFIAKPLSARRVVATLRKHFS